MIKRHLRMMNSSDLNQAKGGNDFKGGKASLEQFWEKLLNNVHGSWKDIFEM